MKNTIRQAHGKQGFANIILIVVIAVLIGAVGYFAFVKNKEPLAQQLPTPSPINATDKFDEKSIIKSVSFSNSVGEEKKFIIVDTGEKEGIMPIADEYISDSKLSKTSAIKIPNLSGKQSGLGAGDNLLVSVSSGPDKKFIVVTYQIGDSQMIELLDESGNRINANIFGKAMELVKDKCQCGFGFNSWKNQSEFYVEARTNDGNYKILIDANTGKVIGAPIKITITGNISSFTDADLKQGWYWGDKNQKKPGTPSTWLLSGDGTRSATWYNPKTSIQTSTSSFENIPNPVGFSLPTTCKIAGAKGDVELPSNYILKANEWLVDCGASGNAQARTTFGASLKQQGWAECSGGLATAKWFKDKTLTSIVESAGAKYPFRVSQLFNVIGCK